VNDVMYRVEVLHRTFNPNLRAFSTRTYVRTLLDVPHPSVKTHNGSRTAVKAESWVLERGLDDQLGAETIENALSRVVAEIRERGGS